VIGGLVVLALGLFIGRGGARPQDPSLVQSTVRRAGIPGFAPTSLRVSSPVGTGRFCAALAATAPQRQQGLMGRFDLGDYDAMVFQFEGMTTAAFHMRNTPLPVSIAWFDDSGKFVSATDMEPCPDRADCPQYRATGPYRTAVEVPRGQLDNLGLGPGSVITVGGPC
jgi:uncharacterized membrane protein (UPF0127 family)